MATFAESVAALLEYGPSDEAPADDLVHGRPDLTAASGGASEGGSGGIELVLDDDWAVIAGGDGDAEGEWDQAKLAYTPDGEAFQVMFYLEAKMRGRPLPPSQCIRREVMEWLQGLDPDDLCLMYDTIKIRRIKVSDIISGKRDLDGKKLDDGLVPWHRPKREADPDVLVLGGARYRPVDAAPVVVWHQGRRYVMEEPATPAARGPGTVVPLPRPKR